MTIHPLLKEKTGALAFALAAFFTPVIALFPSSCGTACGSCPLTGGCLIIPAVAVGIGAFSVRSRIRGLFDRIVGKSA